ncbi:carboxypeptidase regulatory-like domain-containing protein [Micromonospora sp. FIMYZ51]|uniref:carboxypeptidase regulatory-like domain-containing protein n=1 Tax=Micromonospora sp. FIMYZ51 TaxID=3051832 RepID=UPI00311D80D6
MLSAAAVATLLAITGLTGPSQAAGSAGLDGTVVDKLTGAPVAGAGIVIQQEDGSGWNFTNSDAEGRFAFPDADAGQYLVQVMANGYVEQWLNGHENRWEADLITVPATLQIPLMPIQYGDVAGRVVTSKGAGISGVNVQLRRAGNWVADTGTDSKGRYRFDRVETGTTYTVQFTFPSGQVLYHGGVESEYDVTPLTVAADATTQANLTRPPVGNLTVRALDSVTRRPVADYCWYPQDGPLRFHTTCTDHTGRARLRDLPVGTYSGGGFDQKEVYSNGLFGPTEVVEDKTVTTTVLLVKSVHLRVDFVDAVTGDPVEGACVTLAHPVRTDVGQNGQCGSYVEYDNLFAEEEFRLFVAPYDGVHGAQWVSTTGAGTGDPAAARVFRPAAGEHVQVTVRLDAGGTVTGVVKDATTGAGLRNVCPTATGPSSSYSTGVNSYCTYGDDGGYHINMLGPYEWKLAFPAYDGQHAWAWSGDAANRAAATPVQVVAGQTTTLDVALPATGTISGTVTVPAGVCLTCVTIQAMDAATGDYAGVSPRVRADGTFTITGLNSQDVQLYYSVGDDLVAYPTQLRTRAGEAVTGVAITVPAA